MQILVTGGAGYIGSGMVRTLIKDGHDVTVLDTLEHGHRGALPEGVQVTIGSIGDSFALEKIFSEKVFDAVIHFAGYISVSESVINPIKYFDNNLIAATTLLEVMEKYAVKRIIFSSTAAVYGIPQTPLIAESHPRQPSSPYGLSKWYFEQLLRYYDEKSGIKSISLRYFNASGASLDGKYGEAHHPESHIIPLAFSTAMGKQSSFSIFGTDYPTPDGTCLRDYVHINDLAQAHMVALHALMNGHGTDAFNVGTGDGITNRQIIAKVQEITGNNFQIEEKARRIGDPYALVSDPSRLKNELGWKPQYSDLETIIRSAWGWHKSHPEGYNIT